MKLMIGDFADSINDSNGVVKPQKLLTSGHPFVNSSLEDAVRLHLGRQIGNRTEQSRITQ